MEEGLLAGMLGGEEERAEAAEIESALAGVEAFAAAVVAIASHQDPGVARKTEEFLTAQTRLLGVQTAHLHEEHAMRLSSLKRKTKEDSLRLTGTRIRISVQLMTAAIGLTFLVGTGFFVHDAVTSREVVIAPFHAPPGMAVHGIDGAVIAGGLLDELTHLQTATRSSLAALGASGAWAGDIKVEVLGTGISIGEAARLLRERFGHDVHIDGDLVEMPDGRLALTVRGNGVAPKTFSAPATALETLMTQAAEYIYSQSQPARWSSYLNNTQRYAEAIAFCKAAIVNASPELRGRLFNNWGIALQDIGTATVEDSLALFRAAVTAYPESWNGYNNVINSLINLGREEDALQAGAAMLKAADGRPGKAPEIYYENIDLLTWNLQPWLAATLADAAGHDGTGTTATAISPGIADVNMRLHDTQAAEMVLSTAQDDPNDPTIAAIGHFVRGRLASDAGDVNKAASELELFGEAYKDPVVASNYAGYHCWVAPAAEAAGHRDKADAILAMSPGFVDCYRFRADIADHRGDWTGAQKDYAAAVKLAPDLPAAYYSWGLALIRHGDLPGAIARFTEANLRGPHWADPLKAWGDALLAQGHAKDAVEKYDEALKYAPAWAALKAAREIAEKRG